MKKTLIALAALGVVGTAAAEATVYGRVDAGIKNTGGATTVVSGVTGTPRIGFKGTEDLGGGLTAMFGIETGFNNTAEGNKTTEEVTADATLGSGPTRIGDRGAYVGVSGGFGSVMIGSSLLTPSFFVTAATDALGVPNYAPTEARMWGKKHENLRHDSAIQYSNSFSGVTFRLSYVPAGNNSDTAKTNWSAQYSIEGLTVAGASHSAASGKKQNSVIGASYNLGPATIYWNKASGDYAMTGMGVRAPFGAVTAAVAIYDDTTNSKKSTGASLAYALSKATALNVGIKAPKGSNSETFVGLSHSF